MSSSSQNGEARLVQEVPDFLENRDNQISEQKLNGFLAELEKSIEKHLSSRFSSSDTFFRPLWKYIMHYCRMIFRIIKNQIVTFASNVFSSKPPEPESEESAGAQDTSSMFDAAFESMKLTTNVETNEEPIRLEEPIQELESHYSEILEDINRSATEFSSRIAADLENVQNRINQTKFNVMQMENRRQMRERDSEASTSSRSTPEESSRSPVNSLNPGSVQDLKNEFDSLERDQMEFQRNMEEERQRQKEQLDELKRHGIAKQTQARNERTSIQSRINRKIDRNS